MKALTLAFAAMGIFLVGYMKGIMLVLALASTLFMGGCDPMSAAAINAVASPSGLALGGALGLAAAIPAALEKKNHEYLDSMMAKEAGLSNPRCPDLAGKYQCHRPEVKNDIGKVQWKAKTFLQEWGQTTDAKGITTYWHIKDGKKDRNRIADGKARESNMRGSKKGYTRARIYRCGDNTLYSLNTNFISSKRDIYDQDRYDSIIRLGEDDDIHSDITWSRPEGPRNLMILAQFRITCKRLNQ